MVITFNTTVQLTEINCGECGGTYAINERYREQKYQVGGSWNCPYCRCGWGYANNNENAKLKQQLARAKHDAEQAQANAAHQRQLRDRAERRRSAMKGQVTKIRNRVGKGVCPCCNRTFANLQRHMSGQHPDWVSTAVDLPSDEETK